MKNPPPPPSLTLDAWHDLPGGTQLWRIMFTANQNATPYGQLRHWGPTRSRWDPQRGSTDEGGVLRGAVDPDRGVLYTSTDLATAFAEVFQDEEGHQAADTPRIADIAADGATVVSWKISRALRLLDLTGDWALRNGASCSLDSQNRALCRSWARAIVQAAPKVDGLWVRSTMNGREMPVLFTGALDSFSPSPTLSSLLTDPFMRPYVEAAAKACGYLTNDLT